MDQRAQAVQLAEHALALDALLGAEQRDQPEAGKQQRVDRGFDALHGFRGVALGEAVERQDRADEDEEGRARDRSPRRSECRSHQIGCSSRCALCARSRDSDTSSAGDLAQPGLGEACRDAFLQSFGGIDDRAGSSVR